MSGGAGTTDYDKNPATACNTCQLGIGFSDGLGQTGKCKPVASCAAGKEAGSHKIAVPMAFLATQRIRIGLLVDGKECTSGSFDAQSGLRRLEESFLVLEGESHFRYVQGTMK